MPEHDQQLGEFADVLERADREQLARDAAGGEVDREVALLRGSARAEPGAGFFPAALGARRLLRPAPAHGGRGEGRFTGRIRRDGSCAERAIGVRGEAGDAGRERRHGNRRRDGDLRRAVVVALALRSGPAEGAAFGAVAPLFVPEGLLQRLPALTQLAQALEVLLGARGRLARGGRDAARRLRRRRRHHRLHEVASSVGVGHRRDVAPLPRRAQERRGAVDIAELALGHRRRGGGVELLQRVRELGGERAPLGRGKREAAGERQRGAPGGAVGVGAHRAANVAHRKQNHRRVLVAPLLAQLAGVRGGDGRAQRGDRFRSRRAAGRADAAAPADAARLARLARLFREGVFRSRRVLRMLALPRGGDGERVREQPFLRRQRARLSRVAAFQQVLDRAAPAPKPQVDVRVPQRLRHRLQPLELGDVLARVHPGRARAHQVRRAQVVRAHRRVEQRLAPLQREQVVKRHVGVDVFEVVETVAQAVDRGGESRVFFQTRDGDLRLAPSPDAAQRALQVGRARPRVRGKHHQLPPVREERVGVHGVYASTRFFVIDRRFVFVVHVDAFVEARVRRNVRRKPGDGNRRRSRRRVPVVAVARA